MRRIYFLILLLSLLLSTSLIAGKLGGDIEILDWEGIKIVWLKDDRFPTYNVVINFADGAASDVAKLSGETNLMFSMLGSGTRRFSQKEISSNLEFYGVGHGADVKHENTNYMVAGLVKDIVPTMKKICHLFSDANFPNRELKKYKNRLSSSLRMLVSNHGALASRAFRELSFKGRPYQSHVEGKRKSIGRIKRTHLLKKLKYFNNKVVKKIYLSGPSKVLSIKSIINKECGWRGHDAIFSRTVVYKSKVKISNAPQIFLIPVKDANQAQVRVGRFLEKGEYDNFEAMSTVNSFLGGGFTSQLMRELRVKRGLTYTARSFISGQKDYGRAGISTFTKNATLTELLNTIKDTLARLSKGEFDQSELERAKGHLSGSYPFSFERSAAYLSKLVYYDHVGKDYDEIFNFPTKVMGLKKGIIIKGIQSVFDWNKQTIVVVGNKSLLPQLKKIGKTVVVSSGTFL